MLTFAPNIFVIWAASASRPAMRPTSTVGASKAKTDVLALGGLLHLVLGHHQRRLGVGAWRHETEPQGLGAEYTGPRTPGV